MADNFKELTSADFELVHENLKIHDTAFQTKPTTFFKDAIKRFCKNKSSIVAFGIIGFLVLLAIFVPVFSNKNIDFVSADERFLAPKLFKAGTGFWDGTREYEGIIYDEKNQTPAEFYKPGVMNLVVLGESFIDVPSKYGSGGYAVLINETLENKYFYSFPTTITNSGNYSVKIKFYDLPNYNDNDQADYAIYLQTDIPEVYNEDGSVKEYKKILIKDFSKEYGEFEYNLSQILSDNGIESVQGSVYFDIKPSTNSVEGSIKRSYIMLESVIFDADKTVANYEELTTKISMVDANTSLLYALGENSEKPVGYWTATAIKNIHHVRVVKCNFTYDTYKLPYGNQEAVYYKTDLQTLKDKGYCDYDEKDVVNTFKVLDEDKCPIVEITEATYTTRKPIKLTSVKCVVKKYLTYTHGGTDATYSKEPIFIFGTDDKGHDVFKKSFAGLRTSLILGVCTAAFCFLFGLVWGSISGYFGGTVDLLMERFCDILGGVPSTIVLTIAILKFGNNFLTFFLALCMTGWMGVAGRTRTQFYRYKGREYVLASRTLGSSDLRLIFKHILPNSMGTIITSSVLMITSVIYSEATLAYLQLGLQGTQSFGVMMSDNQQYLHSYPYLVLEPAVIISLMMISFNLFGNGLRDAFNPSLKGSE